MLGLRPANVCWASRYVALPAISQIPRTSLTANRTVNLIFRYPFRSAAELPAFLALRNRRRSRFRLQECDLARNAAKFVCGHFRPSELVDAIVNFLAVNRDIGWRGDPDANLAPVQADNFDRYGTVDENFFANFAAENEHDFSPSVRRNTFDAFYDCTRCANCRNDPDPSQWINSEGWGRRSANSDERFCSYYAADCYTNVTEAARLIAVILTA
jgi:hypothetical protein